MTTLVAHPRKNRGKALWRVEDGLPNELLIFCPGCKALEVVRFTDEVLIPTRKFTQKAGRIYHDCGSGQPCRLHTLHGTVRQALRRQPEPRLPRRRSARV